MINHIVKYMARLADRMIRSCLCKCRNIPVRPVSHASTLVVCMAAGLLTAGTLPDAPGVSGVATPGSQLVHFTNPRAAERERERFILEVRNPLPIARTDLITLNVQQTEKILADKNTFRLVDSATGGELLWQVVSAMPGTGQHNSKKQLLIRKNLKAEETAVIRVITGQPKKMPSYVYGRLVPERADDFAWENDRVAFRIYGPALERTGEISNGIDAWMKRTTALVIDKWYQQNDYHKDHGEGLDDYKVGRTLGAGALAPVLNDTFVLAHNFSDVQILEKGPLRFTFVAKYKPFSVGKNLTEEIRTISLDAGSHFNRIYVHYPGLDRPAQVAAGILMHDKMGQSFRSTRFPALGYWEAAGNAVNGKFGVGVIYPAFVTGSNTKDFNLTIQVVQAHLAGIVDMKNNKIMYYSGTGWSKAGFEDSVSWFAEIDKHAECLQHPVQVTMR